MTWALLRNYAKIAVRNLAASKLYTGINIVGLSVGLAAVTLASIYLRYELAYEDPHANKDRIYRVVRETTRHGESPDFHRGETAGALAAALRREFPEIEAATLLSHSVNSSGQVEYNGNTITLNHGNADAGFFDIFTFPLAAGTAQSLRDPSSVLVTESAARRIFGDENPIGQQLTYPAGSLLTGRYTVTGVVKDVPGRTRLRFDLFAGLPQNQRIQTALESWRVRGWIQTYVLLREGTDPSALEARMPAFAQRNLPSADGVAVTYRLQPLSRIRLHSRADFGIHNFTYGDIDHVHGSVAIAMLVMLSACINFVILSTARSGDRSREIGIRKVSGARRSSLIQQFLGEAVIISVLSLVGGIMLAWTVLPGFSDLVYPGFRASTGVVFTETRLALDAGVLPVLVGLTVLTGLLAGSYPAIVLSRAQPATVVQQAAVKGASGRRLRQSLVVVQFGLAVAIAICTWTVHRQVQYLSQKDLGYNTERVVMMTLYRNNLKSDYKSIKQEFLRNPQVSMASCSNSFYGGGAEYPVFPEGEGSQDMRMIHLSVDEDYLAMFDIKLVAGRGFRDGADGEAYLLNETAVRQLGWTDDPIGKRFDAFELGLRPGYVVGVTRDFHFDSLREPIGPLFITKEPQAFVFLSVKLAPGNLETTMAFVDSVQRTITPVAERRFVDVAIASRYEAEQRLQQVLTTFSSVAIIIACVGVFGFVCYASQQRAKEIAVRKVLGATDRSIVRLLSWDFVALAAVANVLAWPAAFWALRQWLDGFAYRTDVSLVVFMACGATVLGLVVLTAAQQGYRAATANPVDSLRGI